MGPCNSKPPDALTLHCRQMTLLLWALGRLGLCFVSGPGAAGERSDHKFLMQNFQPKTDI